MTTLLDPEHREHVTDQLDGITQQTGESPYQVFSDWIDMAVASFSGDEDAYQKPLDRYRTDGRDEETVRELATLHSNALGGLVLAMEETREDILGGVYEHYSLTSEHFAQYFTPGAVSRAIHAVAETAAVGSLYAPAHSHTIAAVCLLQVGVVGWGVVDAVPPAAEAGMLALIGGILLAVGIHEGYHRYADGRSIPSPRRVTHQLALSLSTFPLR